MFKQYFKGGLAATAALVPTIAPAAAQAAPSPAPEQATGRTSGVDPSTLESCTAKFGLTKSNSTLVSFHETVIGTATPVPYVDADIVPVLTYDNGKGPEQCVPVPAWTDEASFDSFMSGFTGMFPYPGTGYYALPGGGLLLDGGSIPTSTYHFDFVMGASFTAVWTLEWTPGLTPYPWASMDAAWAAAVAKVRLLLPEAQRTAWDTSAITANQQCAIDDADLRAALVDLVGGPGVVGSFVNDSCVLAQMAVLVAIFDLQIENNIVPLVITSGSEVAVPVTGTASMPIVLTASALAGLGGALVFTGRRRRIA